MVINKFKNNKKLWMQNNVLGVTGGLSKTSLATTSLLVD
jgi:hypothetical protein